MWLIGVGPGNLIRLAGRPTFLHPVVWCLYVSSAVFCRVFFFGGRRFCFSGCGAGVDCGIPFVPLSVSGNIEHLRRKVSQVARRSGERNRHSGVKTKQLNKKIETGSRTLRGRFYLDVPSFFLFCLLSRGFFLWLLVCAISLCSAAGHKKCGCQLRGLPKQKILREGGAKDRKTENDLNK